MLAQMLIRDQTIIVQGNDIGHKHVMEMFKTSVEELMILSATALTLL